METVTLSNFHISHPETDVTHRPHNTEGFSECCEKDWLGERAVDPRWGVGRTVTNDKLHNDVKKKGKGKKSVTSEFVRFEGVKLFALFAVIKFHRRSKTAINYGCKGIRFQRAAAADMSFGFDTIQEFSSDYLSCKRRAVKNKLTGLLCCCSRAGIRRASVWAALHPHCPKAVFLIILMRERCSNLHCLYSRAALFTLYLY